jgi:DNA-binding FrmR family transcriptional regulator
MSHEIMQKRRQETLVHINRIQGQMEALKKYIAESEDCLKIASLTTSIAKSFDTLRFRTLEAILSNEFCGVKVLNAARSEKLHDLLQLYKR